MYAATAVGFKQPDISTNSESYDTVVGRNTIQGVTVEYYHIEYTVLVRDGFEQVLRVTREPYVQCHSGATRTEKGMKVGESIFSRRKDCGSCTFPSLLLAFPLVLVLAVP